MADYTLLIVDDSEDDRYLLKRQLKKLGYIHECIEAENATEALDLFRAYQANRAKYGDRFPPLLIFLDINMPGLNGYDFLEEYADLRGAEDKLSSVVVMHTSSPQEREQNRAGQWGFVLGYIIKGEYDAEDIDRVVNQAIELRKGRTET